MKKQTCIMPVPPSIDDEQAIRIATVLAGTQKTSVLFNKDDRTFTFTPDRMEEIRQAFTAILAIIRNVEKN